MPKSTAKRVRMDHESGLDLSNIEETTRQEIADFRSQVLEGRGGKFMYPLSAYSFLLENRPDVLKYHMRMLRETNAGLGASETGRALAMLTMLHWYACNRVQEGIIHEVRGAQSQGATKAQVNEIFALAFTHSGPSGFSDVYHAAFDYMKTYAAPDRSIEWPDGWAPDVDAFRTGLDFDVPDLLDGEREQLYGWYESTIGYVPASIAFLVEHNPRFIKAYRAKFEGAMSTGALPKQIVPYILIHYNTMRGFSQGIREAALLARAWCVTRDQVLNAITLATCMTGLDVVNIVSASIADALTGWG